MRYRVANSLKALSRVSIHVRIDANPSIPSLFEDRIGCLESVKESNGILGLL